MAEKSLESTASTSLAGEGTASSGMLRRVDPSHRAPILVRIPNVHQPQQPSISLVERCRIVLMKALNFLIPAVKAATKRRPPETTLASILEPNLSAASAPVEALEPTAMPSVAVPIEHPIHGKVSEPSALTEQIQKLTRAVQMLVWLRSNPGMAVPGLVASALGFFGMLHVMMATTPEVEKDPGPEVFMGSPIGETGLPPLGSVTSLQPANGDGNMAAPTDRMADDSAPPYSPYGAGNQGNSDQGPALVPAMPGVARLKGRIEPLTPTVDSRNDQDRQGIR